MYSNPPVYYPYLTPSSHQWSIPPTYPTNPSFITPTTPSFPSFPWELFSPYYTNSYVPTPSPYLYFNHGFTPPPPNPYSSYPTSHYSPYYNNSYQFQNPKKNSSILGSKFQTHSRNRRDFDKYLQVTHPSFKKRSQKISKNPFEEIKNPKSGELDSKRVKWRMVLSNKKLRTKCTQNQITTESNFLSSSSNSSKLLTLTPTNPFFPREKNSTPTSSPSNPTKSDTSKQHIIHTSSDSQNPPVYGEIQTLLPTSSSASSTLESGRSSEAFPTSPSLYILPSSWKGSCEATHYFPKSSSNEKISVQRLSTKATKCTFKDPSMKASNDILAAMDEAVSDGVPVISLSISSNGYASHYYCDSIVIGVFSVIQYSVVVSYTSVNIAPGILTASASTIDRGWNARVAKEETLTAILILKRSIEVPNKDTVNRLGLLLMKVEGIPLFLVLDDVWQNSEPLIEKIQFLISDVKILITSKVAFVKFSTTCVLKLLENLCVNMPLLSNDARYAFSDPLAKKPYFTSNTIATPPLPPEPPDKSLYIVVTMLSLADLNLLCGHHAKSHFWFFTIITQYSTQAFTWAWHYLNIILPHIAKVLNFGAYVITCLKNFVVVVDIFGILPIIEKNNIQHDALFVPCNLATIFQGFESYVKKSIYGCNDGTKCVSAEIDEAVKVAKKVDYVILDQTQERKYHDRDHLYLPYKQHELIKSVSKDSKRPVILVILCGGPVNITYAKFDDKIGGIFWAGYLYKLYSWDTNSAYIHEPPYFKGITMVPLRPHGVKNAYCLLNFSDNITTDHISPAGNINKDSPD